ncbi:PAS domain-containing sensor histidine kinase [Sneathiella sp.]|uniref:PAS domain-containing sensor histidine kinase n=1 Tax=Sneathiella sp. TaxID=1964365 RepID=UPI0025F5C0C1|nr:ATP-binding protein [Sneathiella sp.]
MKIYWNFRRLLEFGSLVLLTVSFGLLLFSTLFLDDPYFHYASNIAAGGLLFCALLAFFQIRQIRTGQKALRSKDSLLNVILDNVDLGIAVFDEDLKLQAWNRRYLELTEADAKRYQAHQTTLQDVLGWNYDHYVDIELSRDDFIVDTLGKIEKRVSSVLDRKLVTGRIIEIYYNIRTDGGLILTVTDVTSKRMAERSLRENEDRYRTMIELSPDAIVAHKGGYIIYVNEAALRLFNKRGRHDLIGHRISAYFPYSDMEMLSPYMGPVEEMESGKKLPSLKSRVIRDDGIQTNVEMEGSALLYGERMVMQLVIRDISAQMQIEEFLKQAKDEAEYAAKIKGKFLANMSHELRTPLNAVIGFSEVITSQIFGPVGSSKYLEYAEDINASGHHLLDLINDILDFSKIESGEQKINEEAVEIDVLVNECVRLTQQRAIENDINIKLEFDPLLPQIFADRRMIKQILINLLSNAVKFTPMGGRIITSVQLLEDAGLRISVSDNGIGIREDDIEKALTPFVQVDSDKDRKYQGTGLGLPLSKNLAEMHEGRLELMSRYGEGTVVSLYLPPSRIVPKAA